ncbi:MAG: PRC-barrel domain-containing protein [Roseicyclus sp.]
MLISSNDLLDFAIEATDGRRGRATDFYFDDEEWRLRYAVTATGFLFAKQEALVKSTYLGAPDLAARKLPVALTKEELDRAEGPESHPPVSEQRERRARRRRFEFWPPLMLGVPGAAYTPILAHRQLMAEGAVAQPEAELEERFAANTEDPHLRSLREITGYGITATDGEIGSVADALLDPEGWTIRYIVVDTGNWLPGRQVAIRPDRVTAIRWDDEDIVVRVRREEVEGAPELSLLEELERSDAHLALAPYGTYGGGSA